MNDEDLKELSTPQLLALIAGITEEFSATIQALTQELELRAMQEAE